MSKRSLADAKAHFSELVDRAEHRGQKTLILRHGKPAAAIVPVEDSEEAKPKPMTAIQIRDLLLDAAKVGDPKFDAVADLLTSRR